MHDIRWDSAEFNLCSYVCRITMLRLFKILWSALMKCHWLSVRCSHSCVHHSLRFDDRCLAFVLLSSVAQGFRTLSVGYTPAKLRTHLALYNWMLSQDCGVWPAGKVSLRVSYTSVTVAMRAHGLRLTPRVAARNKSILLTYLRALTDGFLHVWLDISRYKHRLYFNFWRCQSVSEGVNLNCFKLCKC